jgi:RND family efflux transporter MFP subunit
VPIRVAAAQSIATEAPAARASTLDASGYVIARRQATVSSKITGRVIEVLIEEGQNVDTAEIVARLDDTNARARVAQTIALLAQEQARLNAARVALANAEPLFERAQAQFDQQVISAQDFDNAKTAYDNVRTSLDIAERSVEVARANLALAQRDLDDTIVRAPFAGVVTVKAAQEGEMVSPVSAGGGFTRTGIGTIVDMSSLEVEVDVSENFINRVTPGQDVTVTLNAYPDWVIPAHVIAIIPTADRAKATVRVRVGLDEQDPRILPQMGVRVAFLASDATTEKQTVRQAVAVPAQAVAVSGDTGTIFVVNGDTVERRAVRVGGQLPDGRRIVLSGVNPGARLAIADFALLADGVSVRIESTGTAMP